MRDNATRIDWCKIPTACKQSIINKFVQNCMFFKDLITKE